MTSKKINVLVVDDSLFMRTAIKKILDAHPSFVVIDTAKNGQEAVDKTIELHPDVITMDYNMPRMNGAEAVAEIMKRAPTPVLMFSAHTQQGAKETFEALSAGAVDFVTKPAGEVSANLDSIADNLCTKLLVAIQTTPRVMMTPVPPPSRRPNLRMSRTMTAVSPDGPPIVVVAISTGGPVALSRVIPKLPKTLRAAIVVIQHMPATFTAHLAERLDATSQVQVREAKDGDTARPGTVLLAPGNKHLHFDRSGTIRIKDGALVHGCRPAADVAMKSAATAFGNRSVGLVMTGMGKDGSGGMQAIKQMKGKTFVQDKESSVIYGMPKSALDLGVVDEIVALDEIALRLQQL